MIKIKPKKCKSQGKAKSFEGCGELSLYRTYGLCQSCFKEWTSTTEEGEDWKIRRTLKQVRLEKKEEEKKKEARFNKMKEDSTNWLQKLQPKVQEIARLIDWGQPCTARGTKAFTFKVDGGHVLSKGSNSQCRFNLHNIFAQSAQSNTHFSDDELMKEGVARIYGQEYLDFINSFKAAESGYYKNLKPIYDKACKIATELRKKGNMYTTEERIELRNKINVKLGVYPLEYCIFDRQN